ncbi:MAG TPA: VOC family protein [Pyrinomonadaceae bacterium]|nr:VOC family protein [Pyrinomonadaceae bacterium]
METEKQPGKESEFLSAVPILASLNTDETIEFYSNNLGLETVHHAPHEYLIMKRGSIEIHFWHCRDRHIAESTACRIKVSNINRLYEECTRQKIVHPNGKIEDMPWGSREFGMCDSHGNLITFYEELE